MATIGIDVTALYTPASGGIGTSQYQTLRALSELDTPHRFVMYAAKPPVVPFSDEPLDVPFELRLGSGFTARSNILWMQTGVNRLLAADGVDLVWGPRHLLPFRARSVARVATIHDLWHAHFPGQQPPINRALNRALIGRILKVADHIVTMSQATADDVVSIYQVAPDRMTVVPLGVDTSVFRPASPARVEELRARLGLPERYLLSLDVFNPRKNFRVVLEAFALLPQEKLAELQVVGIGRRRATSNSVDPYAVATSLGVSDRVRILDDVDHDDLVTLYSGALAFIYPSVYEGFGMPVLEAMACGCPVVASNRSSLPEVAGDAGVLVDPENADAVAAAVLRLASSPSETAGLVERGIERASEFTWRRTAEGMLVVFDRVLERRT
ncbi:MAG: glycosyltransferase family 1 protein [Coriobacteriia bacterium]